MLVVPAALSQKCDAFANNAEWCTYCTGCQYIRKGVVNLIGQAQVLYNAQMIRTWSLLLRNARRLNYIVSGRQVGPLSS